MIPVSNKTYTFIFNVKAIHHRTEQTAIKSFVKTKLINAVIFRTDQE